MGVTFAAGIHFHQPDDATMNEADIIKIVANMLMGKADGQYMCPVRHNRIFIKNCASIYVSGADVYNDCLSVNLADPSAIDKIHEWVLICLAHDNCRVCRALRGELNRT